VESAAPNTAPILCETLALLRHDTSYDFVRVQISPGVDDDVVHAAGV